MHYYAGFKDCSNNRYIYSALNWEKFDQTLTGVAIVLFVVSPLIAVAFWGCFKTRANGIDAQRNRYIAQPNFQMNLDGDCNQM